MTSEEITQYNWYSFLQGDKVYMMPVNPFQENFEPAFTFFGYYINDNTFQAIGIEPNKTYAGSDLELIWQLQQLNDEWIDTTWDITSEQWKFKRQVLRLKSSIADAEKPKEPIKVNCLHASCPTCGADIDVIPAEGTYINKGVNQSVEQETLAQAVDKLLQKGSLKRDERAQSIYYMGAQFGYKFAKNEPLTLKQIQGVLETMRDVCNIGTSQFEYFTSMAEDIYNKQFER